MSEPEKMAVINVRIPEALKRRLEELAKHERRTMTAQLVYMLEAAPELDRESRNCLHCGERFEAGPGTGRRRDAKFCSDLHRITFNSRRRTEVKLALAP